MDLVGGVFSRGAAPAAGVGVVANGGVTVAENGDVAAGDPTGELRREFEASVSAADELGLVQSRPMLALGFLDSRS